ncbi:MAG: hypothetical protein ACRDSE_00110 [Pseudonocardiaceae bacterium]
MSGLAAQGNGEPSMPYEEVTTDAFAEHAAGFDIEETANHCLVLRGTCPRCGHTMEYRISEAVIKAWRWPRIGRTPVAPLTPVEQDHVEEMCCTCDQEHPGRPKDYLGCGAYWDVEVVGSP